MGSQREAGLPATEPGNQAGGTVSITGLVRFHVDLVHSHIDAENYREALAMTEVLLKELKQLDDKIILTEVFLLESRAAHAIQNMPRAKVSFQNSDGVLTLQAALTSARTTANSIYCPPILQAQLDLQAGAINADDKDYKTAYSYFFEAFEGFIQVDEADQRTLRSLKYMLLCKIMMGQVSVGIWHES